MSEYLLYAAFVAMALALISVIGYCEYLRRLISKIVTVLVLMDQRLDGLEESTSENVQDDSSA